MTPSTLPVVIIGAGPVGLAAAAHVLSRHLRPLVLEAGAVVAAGIRRWAHVRMFSPWKFNVDGTAVGLLTRHGWTVPDPDDYPTGGELVARYLEPLRDREQVLQDDVAIRPDHAGERAHRVGLTVGEERDEVEDAAELVGGGHRGR